MAELELIVPDFDPEREALGCLAVCLVTGQITRGEFDEWGQMLGLIPDPDVQAREPRGHLKGVRGRAVPTFDKRRGAVGA